MNHRQRQQIAMRGKGGHAPPPGRIEHRCPKATMREQGDQHFPGWRAIVWDRAGGACTSQFGDAPFGKGAADWGGGRRFGLCAGVCVLAGAVIKAGDGTRAAPRRVWPRTRAQFASSAIALRICRAARRAFGLDRSKISFVTSAACGDSGAVFSLLHKAAWPPRAVLRGAAHAFPAQQVLTGPMGGFDRKGRDIAGAIG